MGDMAVTRDRVAEVLKDLRRLHGTAARELSQEKAAQRANVQTRDWNRWENKHTLAGPTSLGKVADAFGIPLDVFDDGKVDRSQMPLGERLDQIEAKLDRLVSALAPAEPEEVAQAFERASEASPPANERKRSSKRTRRATRPSSG